MEQLIPRNWLNRWTNADKIREKLSKGETLDKSLVAFVEKLVEDNQQIPDFRGRLLQVSVNESTQKSALREAVMQWWQEICQECDGLVDYLKSDADVASSLHSGIRNQLGSETIANNIARSYNNKVRFQEILGGSPIEKIPMITGAIQTIRSK